MNLEEDIVNVIQRKLWTVEQLLPQAQELTKKTVELPKEMKKNIPHFSNDWSEDNVKKHVEKLHAIVRDPIRYKNRKLIEELGLQTKEIPDGVFDDSLGIRDAAGLFGDLRKFKKSISDILVQKGALLAWLKEGTDKAKEGLQGILNAKTAFERISESGIDESLRDELIQRSATDIGFVSSAEDAISKVKFISGFKISIQYDGEFDRFLEALENIQEKLTKLQEDYGIQIQEISTLVKGKSLPQAHELLEKELGESFQKKNTLLIEWKMYSTTLKSLGSQVPEVPTGIHELEKEIGRLKTECMNRIGEEGMVVLEFLKGEAEFPEEVSKESVTKVLVILRPLFSKFLREES
jgi:hypothetical protein